MRTIEARISIRGLPTRNLVVARYRAPGPARAGRPRVRVTRRGTTLLVRWSGAANVSKWTVLVRQRNGARRVLVLRPGRRSVRVAGVSRVQSGLVTVRGVTRRGAAGPRAIAAFRATARATTRFDRYRRGPGPLPRRSTRRVA